MSDHGLGMSALQRTFGVLLGAGLGLAVCLAPRVAHADSGASAAAEALFDDGRKLMKLGRYDEACAKFAESQRLDAGVGTLIYLADCYEKGGRLASAWATFREGAAAARVAGQADREKLCRERAAALEPKLTRLVIDVPRASVVPGLSIRRGQVPVGRALWGSEVPLDAGTHEIHAEAPGYDPWLSRTDIVDGAGVVRIEVPALRLAAKSDPAAAPPVDSAPSPVQPAPPGGVQRTAGWIMTGVGVAAAGTGIYFWTRGQSKHDDALTYCTPGCNETARSLQDDAKAANRIGTVAVIAGSALAGAGLVLVLTAPAERTAVGAGLGPGGPLATFTRRW